MKAYRDPVHRHVVLERERALADELFRPHSDAELLEAARALGREDLLPDPQQDWLRVGAA
jgi:hypothetical protein